MSHDKKILDREAVRSVIQQWNANRLDLFALSEPDDNLLFHGVMRFYFQDAGQKIATKCIRVASDATVVDVIDTLIEKFRPDMRMLSLPNYALYEVHANGDERRLNIDEKPLLVQLNWHIDDREGRFLLKNIDHKTTTIEQAELNFKRKFSKREKKELKKKVKLSKLNYDSNISLHTEAVVSGNTVQSNRAALEDKCRINKPLGDDDASEAVAGKLYTELPETSFTRSISNPEAVMRRRRQQKLEKKLQQFRSRDGGPDTGGTLKIYGESLCVDVPYKTLLLSIRDCAQAVVREMLTKYGLEKSDPLHFCLVQVNSDATEYILDDDECPLSILMNHPTSRGSIMFHVRRRPADLQPRRRKKKPLGSSNGINNINIDREGPVLVEVTHTGDGGRQIKLGSDPIEVGSANTNCLQLFGPSIQPRHCLISLLDGVCTVTPLHTDALTFVNGHHITQPTILHNGSVAMFGRVASYRFLDSPSDGHYNLAFSQTQLDSACLYESNIDEFYEKGLSDLCNVVGNNVGQCVEGYLENETKSITSNKSNGSNSHDRSPKMPVGNQLPLSSPMSEESHGQEPILPAVLEFPETHQELFLRHIISELDVNVPHFKLAPVYTLYLCARYRASTHYRPELQPTERAHKLTIFLHHVANLVSGVIQVQYSDPRILAFWMANSSEFLHFLKSDRHISAFSALAQEVLAESVQIAFRNLVNCYRQELSPTLSQFLSETIDHDSAAGLVLTVLGSAMALLRRCRVNAALTIQIFSQLFHYINVICFNTIISNSHMCTTEWGKVMTERLQLLEIWAERQGLELAADCHLAKINQCAQFLQASKSTVEEIQQLACSCFRLNSLQMEALLQQDTVSRNIADAAIRMAESVADELSRADGRDVRLEESPELHLALLLPDDGFSCDVVRGIPSGLVDFLNSLQQQNMCRLAAQPTSVGMWTVYMHQFNPPAPSAMANKLPQPEVQIIKLQKNSNGMGLSIVAAKGAGQERLGIYIKSVVSGGAADADGRLQAGDQLLRVDGQSLIGITQERAADFLVRTGPVVSLEVAKQGAIYHGLATLLQQPSPVNQRGNQHLSEHDLSRKDADGTSSSSVVVATSTISNSHNYNDPPIINQSTNNNKFLTSITSNSTSVPVLKFQTGFGIKPGINFKSSSTHNLQNNTPNSGELGTDQNFYQNLSVYHAQTQNRSQKNDRSLVTIQNESGNVNSPNASYMNNFNQEQQLASRPVSAFYHDSQNSLQQLSQSMTAEQFGKNISASSNTLNNLHHHQNLTTQHHTESLLQINRSKSQQNFQSELQGNNTLRMQQMMTPSMPNISNMYQQQTLLGQQHKQQPQKQKIITGQNVNNIDTSIESVFQSDMGGLEYQQHSSDNILSTHHRNLQFEVNNCHKIRQPMSSSSNFMILPPKSLVSLQSPSKQNNDLVSLPAPKPHLRLQQQHVVHRQGNSHPGDDKPPLPPTATHPLYNATQQVLADMNYVASSMDPPKGSYVPGTQVFESQKSIHGTNPWEREEREKNIEIRREQVRLWREQQIAELSIIGSRTQQQEEQLRTLILERDFERRARELNEQEDDIEMNCNKDKIQEVIRLSSHISAIHTSNNNFRQTEVKMASVKDNVNSKDGCIMNSEMQPINSAFESDLIGTCNASAIIINNVSLTQPKSILKNNRHSESISSTVTLSSPSKTQKSASFADERYLNTEHPVSNLTKNFSEIMLDNPTLSIKNNIKDEASEEIAPPPPPERNSSFIIMSKQNSQGCLDTTSVNLHLTNDTNTKAPGVEEKNPFQSSINCIQNNNTIQLLPLNVKDVNEGYISPSVSGGLHSRDNKRVSFHSEENKFEDCNLQIQQKSFPFQLETYSHEQSDGHSTRGENNDTDSSTLQSMPATLEAALWNTSVQTTPGVIGAQEVYRDPRQRRLAEKQQQLQLATDTVPEKLSFKEKMKMFALESGEEQTPKNKIKISRAQRDIDVVH